MEFVKVNVFLLEILSVVDNRIIIKNNQLNVETQALISFATKLVATDQTPAERVRLLENKISFEVSQLIFLKL